jgi:hypothetical protein
MTNTPSGRDPTGQALVSDEAPAGLHPSGFDPSRGGFRQGPWRVQNYRGKANHLLRIVDERGQGIARVNSTTDDEANAKLIAAAPDLFNVLSLVEAAYDLRGDGKPEVLHDETTIMAAIESVLRKVRGGAAPGLRKAVAAHRASQAQGTEAQRAETVEQGSVHDGPVAEGDAPKPSRQSEGT